MKLYLIKKIIIFTLNNISKVLLFFFKYLPKKRNVLNRDKLTIIKVVGMGDCLCLAPIINHLSKNFKITFITTKKTNPNFLNKILPNVCVEVMSIKNFLMLLYKSYNSFLSIDFEQSYVFTELLSNLSTINAGFKTPYKGNSFDYFEKYDLQKNEKILFLDLVLKTKIIKKIDYVSIHNNFLKNFKSISNQKKNYLILYPGSSTSAIFRRMHHKFYIEVIKKYHGMREIIIMGGSSELNIKHHFENIEKVSNMINVLSLEEIFEFFLNNNVLFVGTDAGLLHLANLANVTTIGIFGPNLKIKWGSLYGNDLQGHCIIQPCINLEKGVVPYKCPLNTIDCLKKISVKTLLGKIYEFEG